MEYACYKTRSGLNYGMDSSLHKEVMLYDGGTGRAMERLEMLIMTGEFFPIINRFVATIVILFLGYTSFLSILLINLAVGLLSALIWKKSSLYKVGLITVLYCYIGQSVFRFFIHIITLGCLAIFVFHNWLILIYIMITGIVCQIAEANINGYKYTYKHNNAMARFILNSMDR